MNPKGIRGKRAGSVVLSGQASPAAAQLNITSDKTPLRRQLEANILEHVTILENAAASLSKEGLDRGGRQQAEREARKLAGSLGLFGYTLAKECAREIEHLLEGDSALQPEQALQVRELITTLREHLEKPPEESPSAAAEPASVPPRVLRTLEAEKPKILAVDDDPLVLASLQSLLKSYEFALVTHVDPLTLLETLEKTTPDLLILDIDMPDVNGIELCRTVRNHPRWCTLPVLFLTAMTDPQTVDKVFAVRADDYIRKPFVGAELLARIRVRLERASTLHQMSDDLHRITISRDDLVAEVKMRKEVEEELQRSSDGIKVLNKELQNTNAKLREFDQRKDEFVNNVSHEIRTPLTIIRESISQVADGLFGEVPAAQKTYLNKSLVAVDRLVNIINDLLAVAKIENLKLQVLKTKVSMSSLVADVMSIYETKAQAKGLGLGCVLPQADLHASIDQEKVLQVFGNLISNAIKFTEKGHITISICEIGEFIECSISDTGKGMAQEDIPKLFNKFEQIGQHQYSEGTGLGLTISKGIVELHGGNIRVISVEGKGSTFTFTLPKYSFNESLIQNSKKLLVSAIAKFHQFTIVKLTVDTADQQTSNIAHVSHSIRACLYRRVDEVFQEGNTVYIVLPDTKKADGRVVIDRIRRELKQQNNQVHLGVQMLSYPEDGSTEDELTIKFEGEKVGAS
jgi:signal transduction histidine kinase/HPt (histidine-containing phosphotransfer) domain-containing protein